MTSTSRAHIRDIPDFPKPGIVFKDITPLLLDPPALDAAIDGLARYARDRGVDLVIAAEARGFILGGAIARGSAPASSRAQAGQAARTTRSRAEYLLEYGADALEVHTDALAGGARVLVHDDLLATGGTARRSASSSSSSAARSSAARS